MLVSFFNIAIFIYGVSCHRLDGKIVGGTNANIKDYPYQVSFQYANRHRCGASLIKPNIVVTAAHCTEDVAGLEKYLTIRAGSSFSQRGGQVAGIHAICDHPKFNIDTLDYDVSILVLNRSLPLGVGIQAIGLQPAGVEIAAGTMGTTTGWGRIKEAGAVSEQLQQIQVPKISDLDCQELYKQNATITKRMMCFGFLDGKKDTCQGDSGGPLVVAGKLAGIISWGLGCAKPKQPGVYTKISDSEISSHVSKCLKSVSV